MNQQNNGNSEESTRIIGQQNTENNEEHTRIIGQQNIENSEEHTRIIDQPVPSTTDIPEIPENQVIENEEEQTRVAVPVAPAIDQTQTPRPASTTDKQAQTPNPEPQPTPVAPRKKKSGTIWIILLVVLLLGAAGAGAYYYFEKMNKSGFVIGESDDEDDSKEKEEKTEEVDTEESIICDFITRMYNSGLYNNDDFLERHCTPRLLQKLQDDYDYDCDGTCYASWDFRLGIQEGHPDREIDDHVVQTQSQGDGWYTYEFYDSGFRGINRVKAFIKDDEVMLDALENVYDESHEYYEKLQEEEREHLLSLIREDGSRTLSGFIVNDEGESESITITFYQEDGEFNYGTYTNTGTWNNRRYETYSIYGRTTDSGYRIYSMDEDGADLEIVIDLSGYGLEGYVERYGNRYSATLYFNEN